MGWQTKRRGRERILVFGGAKTGKSTAVVDIAAQVYPAKVHVIDTDYAYDVMVDGATDNLQVYPIDLEDWDGLMAQVVGLNRVMGPDDWLVIDSMSPTWDMVQGAFIQKIFKQDIADYFIHAREKSKGSTLDGLEGWKDYSVINKMYMKLYQAIYRCPGHVLLTAEGDSVSKEDGKDIKDMFGWLGKKPKGQKRLAFVPHSVLYLGKKGPGVYVISTLGDRQRTELRDASVDGGFAKVYLWGVGGWRPARGQ